MIQQVLSHYNRTGLTGVGLLLFMGVFVGALFWVFRKGSTVFYTNLSQLPLKEENNDERE